jgi:hypothetical protein
MQRDSRTLAARIPHRLHPTLSIRTYNQGSLMRRLMALPVFLALISGCESMNRTVADSRQDRCQRADWAMVGERDGATSGNQTMLSDRYSYICGDMYNDAAYKEGFAKGFARRPKPQS